MIDVVCISDLHGEFPKEEIPQCDILIIAGDIFPVYDHSSDFQKNWLEEIFVPWCDSQDAQHVLLVAGNHDFLFEQESHFYSGLCTSIGEKTSYLQDSSISVEIIGDTGLSEKVNVYGTPWSLSFGPWAFMMYDHELEEVYSKIPDQTDIVISHGPMHGLCDRTVTGIYAGSRTLKDKIREVNPSLFVCGHIHEGFGSRKLGRDTLVVNASLRDERYRMANPPVKVTIPTRRERAAGRLLTGQSAGR